MFSHRVPPYRQPDPSAYISISRIQATGSLVHTPSHIKCTRDCHVRRISLSDQQRRQQQHVTEPLRRPDCWFPTAPAAPLDNQRPEQKEHHHHKHHYSSSHKRNSSHPHYQHHPHIITTPTTTKPAPQAPPPQPAGKPAKPPTLTPNPASSPPSNRARPTNCSRSTTSTSSSNRGRASWIWATLLAVGARLRRIGSGRAAGWWGLMLSPRCRRGA